MVSLANESLGHRRRHKRSNDPLLVLYHGRPSLLASDLVTSDVPDLVQPLQGDSRDAWVPG